MAPIKSRYKCNLCDCICEKHPAFKNYKFDMSPASHMQKHRIETIKAMKLENETGWVCDCCLHPAKNHSFTFETPKKKDENNIKPN